jgi:hypothetical protein
VPGSGFVAVIFISSHAYVKTTRDWNGRSRQDLLNFAARGNAPSHRDIQEIYMADLYLKALESERRSLWATARLKGLAKDTPERLRISEIDANIAAHKSKAKTALK